MRIYRVKKANDRQMAPLGRGVASGWLRLVALGCGEMSSDRPFNSETLPKLVQSSFREQALSLQKLNSASQNKEPTGKSSVISGFGTPAGSWKRVITLRVRSFFLEKSNTQAAVSIAQKKQRLLVKNTLSSE